MQTYATVGGRNVGDDIRALRDGSIHVVSGTPGRLNHLISEGYLRTQHVRVLVLDEADVMLSQGFQEQVC